MHYKQAQETWEPTRLPPNVVPFDRKKVCVEVNRITAERIVLSCSDEDLDALCRDLGEAVVQKRAEYYAALEAQAKALNELSRRSGR